MRTKYINFLDELDYQLSKKKVYPQDLIRIMREEDYTPQIIAGQFAIMYYIERIYYDWEIIDYSMNDRIELIKVKDLTREIEKSLKFLHCRDD